MRAEHRGDRLGEWHVWIRGESDVSWFNLWKLLFQIWILWEHDGILRHGLSGWFWDLLVNLEIGDVSMIMLREAGIKI